MSHNVYLPVGDWSDGDPTHRPDPEEGWKRCNQECEAKFKIKIASIIREGQAGAPKVDEIYAIDKFPHAYELWERRRSVADISGIRLDRWVFGYPDGKAFRTKSDFAPHVQYLMSQPTDRKCNCVHCKKMPPLQGRVKPTLRGTISKCLPVQAGPPRASVVVQATLGKRYMGLSADEQPSHVHLFTRLRQKGKVNVSIQESSDINWMCERDLVHKSLHDLPSVHAFLPRIGELVLYFVGDSLLKQSTDTGETRLWDGCSESKLGKFPEWRVGVVTQLPEEPVSATEITNEKKDKKYALNRSGFRVECYPDPNSENKDLSRQSAYVPLKNIRPFNFYRETLFRSSGNTLNDSHPSIQHAIKAMLTVSLSWAYHFKGTWPSATIYHSGIFLGAELLIVGDAVRIMPPRAERSRRDVSDVLVIDSVAVQHSHLKAEPDGSRVTGDRLGSIKIVFRGHAYTTITSRAKGGVPIPLQEMGRLPTAIRSTNHIYQWYHIGPHTERQEVDFFNVIGRAYEFDAVLRWFPKMNVDQLQRLSMTMGSGGVTDARNSAHYEDNRLADFPVRGGRWFWANNRVEALDLTSFNGVDVGDADEGKADKRNWEKILMVLNGAGVKNTTRALDTVDEEEEEGLGKGKGKKPRI